MHGPAVAARWSLADGDRRLAVAILAAACLHAALLWQATPTSLGGSPDVAIETRPLQVRVLTPAGAPPVAAEATVVAEGAPVVPSPLVAPTAVAVPPTSVAQAIIESASSRSSPVQRPTEPATPTTPVEQAAPTPAVAASPLATIAPAGLSPAPDYALAAGLDPGPERLNDVEPEYPERAGLRSGSVVVRILIADTGAIDDVGVVRSTPEGLFEQSALAAVRATRFSPGRRLGIAVKSQLTVEIAFTPIDRGARVSGRSY